MTCWDTAHATTDARAPAPQKGKASIKHRPSLVARITLFAAIVAAVLSAALAVVLMVAAHRFATGVRLADLHLTAQRVAMHVEAGKTDILDLPRQPNRVESIQITDRLGQVIDATAELKGKPAMARLVPDDAGTKEGVVCGGVFEDGRCRLLVAQQAHRYQGDWIVYTSAPVLAAWVAPEVAATVGGCAIIATVVTTVLGNRIVTASLRPVSAIRTELDAINASCPDRRVPLIPCSNEIHGLVQSINLTLTRLQGAMREQRQVAANAAHDLRSPITGIRAEVEDALLAPQETSVPVLARAVLPSLDRLEAIIADLLFIARMDEHTRYVRKPVDLAELVERECRTRHTLTHRLIGCLEPRVVVLGDPVRLGRMFTNLLDNADRYARNTVTVSVRRAAGDRARFPRGMAVLEVADDGPGIDPGKRELVFQRFARLDPTGSTGTGLGLAIARQIAETMGGTLRVEDSPAGARFVVRLPVCFTARLPLPAD